jgi:hypothetical protein
MSSSLGGPEPGQTSTPEKAAEMEVRSLTGAGAEQAAVVR